jgi:hypothetical protein
MAAEDLYANWPVPPLAPADLGVPAPPTPPTPVQVPSAYDPQKASLARLIALAGAIALGPERGGAGLASGVSGELDRREAEHQHLTQLAQQQNEQNQRNYTGEKEKYDSNALGRQKTFESTLQSMRGVVSKLEDQGQYDQQIAGFTNMLRGAGYRVDDNYLRSAIPFVKPTSQSKAGKLLDQAMANAKTWGLSPEQLLDPTHTIEFDANGDGTPEKYTFPQLAALAGRPIVKDETGKPILPAQGDAKIGTPFQEKLGSLLATFKVTNHRDPNEKEKNALVDQAILQSKETPVSPTAGNTRLDRSYSESIKSLEDLQKPVSAKAETLGRLLDNINLRSPQADALLAPEILSAAAGGTGTGLRMNQSELNRITGGRSNWESLRAALQKWSIDPSKALSITDSQRQQMYDIAAAMNTKTQRKLSALNDARQQLIDAPDVVTHRRIIGKLNRDLQAIDAVTTPGPATAGPPANVGQSATDKLGKRP